jgi:glutamine synthetase
MPSAQTVIEQCETDDVELVRVLYTDSGGVTRGRVVPGDDIEGVLTEGANLAQVQQAFTATEIPVPDSAVGGPVGEVRLIPDPDTFTTLPYADRGAVMLANLHELDGDHWAYDPRSNLVDFLAEFPYDAVSAFESEFYLARETDAGRETFDQSGCFAADGMQNTHDLVLEMVDALRGQGMELATYYPEYGPGQQELVVKHSPGITAADQHILFKLTVKAVAERHGLSALFSPKPFKDKPGSGCHLHVSLWDGDDNVFYDPDAERRYGVSETARHFIGGVLEHGPAILALTAPSVVSYTRLQPHSWASAFTCWGHDNREAMVRIPSASASNPEGSTRIEFKAIDNTANPYHALVALLAAGQDGIDRELDPGAPLETDPSELSEAERAERGIERYPETLAGALDALAEDDVLREALGDPLHESYLAVKRYLWQQFNSSVTDWELEHQTDPF